MIDKGVVCEKTDYYSWLLLNSLGTTNGKQGTLVTELFKFKNLYDSNTPMSEVFPKLTEEYPEKYANVGLRDHCQEMHTAIMNLKLMKKMKDAFEIIPSRNMLPVDAYQSVVKKDIEFVELKNIDPVKEPRTAGVMIVPYPPGIPVMMGGEEFDKKSKPILDYLLARQDFENEFPGYESDIHGIERTEPDVAGKKYFKTMLIKL